MSKKLLQEKLTINGRTLSGAAELRHALKNLNCCNETFLDNFSVVELLVLHRAWLASEWDILPDQWTARQVREALRGVPPQWDDDERPVYGKAA